MTSCHRISVLKFVVAPVFNKSSATNYDVLEGNSVTLRCPVELLSLSKIEWYKVSNNNGICSQPRTRGGRGTGDQHQRPRLSSKLRRPRIPPNRWAGARFHQKSCVRACM